MARVKLAPVVVQVPRTPEEIEDAEMLEPTRPEPRPQLVIVEDEETVDTQIVDLLPVPPARSKRITDAYASPAPVLPRPIISVG